MSFLTNKLSVLAVSLLAILSFSACRNSGEPSAEGIEVGQVSENENQISLTKEQFDVMEMKWGSPDLGGFSKEIAVQGMIQVPVEGMQQISTYFGGYVRDLKLLEGQAVRKGEVLFTLENPDFIRLQQDYLEITSQLNYLKAEYERQETLYTEQISAQKNFLKAEADYRGAVVKSESLKKQLGLIHINAAELTPETIRTKVPVISPISGFVTEVFVSPGVFIPASGKAISLISRDHVHIELIVFEKDISSIQKGQTVEITLPDLPAQKFTAEIKEIGQSINEQRQVNVHADFLDKKEESKMIPGMYVQGKIQTAPSQSWSVPEDAIIEVEGESFILLRIQESKEGFLLKKVKVVPGIRVDGKSEIQPVEGLNGNAVLLAKGGFNLL
jgi:membrane fusion protein, heavy metal efflux system